ncbi:oligoribonuclease [Legionella geestiana]|uniref:Oligoribonuclease n=1 Tax=Legionella geestiana TaxID=45065 RepID=A0A0W0TLK0_9GAMM|nr:oligoribonuclease [Legionella geestiana]KTC96457.1 oligoribonuclease [Legionella geestiana]QBS13423.1 oligoribonuclease [Legionella geestiana]QDQ41091.1 oligoribonuclease [Legionella geestiana]STX55056.1 putative ACR [Legionella geestiana]
MKNNTNLIWIDLEMTGLEPDTCRIIEIATLVTDSNLNILAEGPVLAVHQPEEALLAMDAWNTRQHNQSGLVARVRESTVTEAEAEAATIDFLRQYLDAGKSPMCGNSICQDRRFLYRYMPKLAEFFHYRNLDVSTLKELAKRWKPSILSGVTKESRHLAMADIYDSIAELAWYRTHFINLEDTRNASA